MRWLMFSFGVLSFLSIWAVQAEAWMLSGVLGIGIQRVLGQRPRDTEKEERERGIAVCAFIEIVRIHDNLKHETSEVKISGGHKASMNNNLLQTWEL